MVFMMVDVPGTLCVAGRQLTPGAGVGPGGAQQLEAGHTLGPGHPATIFQNIYFAVYSSGDRRAIPSKVFDF